MPVYGSWQFTAALAFIRNLPAKEALERLEQRASELAGSVVMTDAIARAVSSVVGRASVLELEHQRALAEAEPGWLRTIVDDLRTGRSDWNNEEMNFDVGSTIGYPAAGGTRQGLLDDE